MIVIAAGLATVVSALVLTFQRLAAGVPAAPAVTPRICRAAAALFGREQVPPLSARVIVTVCPAPVAAAEQLAKPFVRSTVGVAGTENTEVAFGKTTVTVSPAWSAPVEVELNPTVQVPRAAAASVVEANVTAVGVVAAAITTGEPGLIALVESTEVLTLKVLAASEPAAGFVSPASWSVAGVLGATAHEAPASVTVTVCAAAAAPAVQFANAGPRVTAGLAGTVKPGLKTTVIVEPAASVPVELVVKPTVHVERARAGLRRAGEGDGRDRRVDRVRHRQRRVVESELEQPAVLRAAERPAGAGGCDGVARGVEDLRREDVEADPLAAAAEAHAPVRAQVRVEVRRAEVPLPGLDAVVGDDGVELLDAPRSDGDRLGAERRLPGDAVLEVRPGRGGCRGVRQGEPLRASVGGREALPADRCVEPRAGERLGLLPA